MDEKLEKAFGVANYLATLSNQKRIIKEEFNQKLIHYVNGGTFLINRELINFAKVLVDMGNTKDITFLDVNDLPVVIDDVSKFLDTILVTYFEAINEYSVRLAEIKSKRRLSDIVEL